MCFFFLNPLIAHLNKDMQLLRAIYTEIKNPAAFWWAAVPVLSTTHAHELGQAAPTLQLCAIPAVVSEWFSLLRVKTESEDATYRLKIDPPLIAFQRVGGANLNLNKPLMGLEDCN